MALAITHLFSFLAALLLLLPRLDSFCPQATTSALLVASIAVSILPTALDSPAPSTLTATHDLSTCNGPFHEPARCYRHTNGDFNPKIFTTIRNACEIISSDTWAEYEMMTGRRSLE